MHFYFRFPAQCLFLADSRLHPSLALLRPHNRTFSRPALHPVLHHLNVLTNHPHRPTVLLAAPAADLEESSTNWPKTTPFLPMEHPRSMTSPSVIIKALQSHFIPFQILFTSIKSHLGWGANIQL